MRCHTIYPCICVALLNRSIFTLRSWMTYTKSRKIGSVAQQNTAMAYNVYIRSPISGWNIEPGAVNLVQTVFFCEFALIYLNIWIILSLQVQLQSYLDIKPWWFKWFVFSTYWGGKFSMENLSMTHLYGFISNYDYGFIDTMWYHHHLRNHFPQLRTPMWVLTSAVGFVQMGWSILRKLWEKNSSDDDHISSYHLKYSF